MIDIKIAGESLCDKDDQEDILKKIAEAGESPEVIKATTEQYIQNLNKLMLRLGFSNEAIAKVIDMGFCTAPASTKYHGSHEGGLYEHSINVTSNLIDLTTQLGLTWQRPESPVLIGMFHDLCKTDQYKKTDEGYVYDNSSLIKGHGVKSVLYIQSYLGFPLTEEEIACIIYHMGAFTDKQEWSDYTNAIHKYPNVLWTHTADMMATHIQEVERDGN